MDKQTKCIRRVNDQRSKSRDLHRDKRLFFEDAKVSGLGCAVRMMEIDNYQKKKNEQSQWRSIISITYEISSRKP